MRILTFNQVLLVGVPAVFPERGGTAQLFWGLLVCFLSASLYMMAAPYVEDSDDHLAQLAQLQISSPSSRLLLCVQCPLQRRWVRWSLSSSSLCR